MIRKIVIISVLSAVGLWFTPPASAQLLDNPFDTSGFVQDFANLTPAQAAFATCDDVLRGQLDAGLGDYVDTQCFNFGGVTLTGLYGDVTVQPTQFVTTESDLDLIDYGD